MVQCLEEVLLRVRALSRDYVFDLYHDPDPDLEGGDFMTHGEIINLVNRMTPKDHAVFLCMVLTAIILSVKRCLARIIVSA